MADRRRVEAAAMVRSVTAKNQPPATAIVVDVSDRELGLRLEPGVDMTPDHMIELAIDGRWTLGRVVWSQHGIHDALIATIEVVQPGFADMLLATDEPVSGTAC